MRHYRITVGGHPFEVTILSDPRQTTVHVEVDGQPLTVAVESLPPVTAEGGEERVPLPSVTAGGSEERAESAPAVAGEAKPAAVAGPSTVTAPLPGVIKAIVVRPGHTVAPGAPLLVIEAMKMENILRASRAGVVAAIYVVEGQQVAHGHPLLDYE